MGKLVLSNASITVNAVNLSNRLHQISFAPGADAEEVTAMGDAAHNYLPALLKYGFTADFYADFGAGEVDATLSAILAGGVGVTVTILANGGTESPTNPSYSGTFMLESYDAIAGSVGKAAMVKTSWKLAQSGAVTRTAT